MARDGEIAENFVRRHAMESSILPMAPGRLRWTHSALLVVGYVLLDWASYIHALHGLNITPWSPGPALGLAFVMRFGVRVAAVLFLAIVVADSVVRDLPTTFALTLLIATILASGYTALGEIMRRRFDRSLMFSHHRRIACVDRARDRGYALCKRGIRCDAHFGRGVTVWAMARGLNALLDRRCSRRADHDAAVRHAHGRARPGVSAKRSAPLGNLALWSRHDRHRLGHPGTRPGRSTLLLYRVLANGVGRAARRTGRIGSHCRHWRNSRSSPPCNCAAFATVTVFDVQALAVVLVLVGFLVGVFIDEQRRLGAELRQSLRLAAAGEMAAALAHELNQPLTAMSAYGAACEDLINQGEQGERLLDMVRRMVSESHRTADVVTRLRDFFRTGDTRLERVPVAEVLAFGSRSVRRACRPQRRRAPCASGRGYFACWSTGFRSKSYCATSS